MKKPGVERMLIVLITVLLVLFGVSLCFLARRLFPRGAAPEAAPAATASPAALSTPEDRLPQSLALGKAAPEAEFRGEAGEALPLSGLASSDDEAVWLVFWASWCPDCDEQLKSVAEMEALAEEHRVRLVLVDRLNPEKESVEAAKRKIAEHGVHAPVVYDQDEAVYTAWGFREIPSSAVLDREGRTLGYTAGVQTAGVYEGLLRRALEGRDSIGLAYIERCLTDGTGGVRRSSADGGRAPAGSDALSEGQGLMLWYALIRQDQALFDRTLAYTRQYLMENGLAAWYGSPAGKAKVNATLDDLRIWYALHAAANLWGGDYAAYAQETAQALRDRCVNRQMGLVNYAQLNGPGQADAISLCYLDLVCLEALAAEDAAFAPVLEKARETLTGGRISEAFPLYFAGYDYRKKAYLNDDLNTAEALYTLWNLSRAGMLPDGTMDWLRQRIQTGELAARYHVDGTAVRGFTYHSTAVWALAALISREAGDEASFELALRRMDRMCVLDANDPLFGAYAQKGTDTQAFDQLLPLLVNAWVSGGNDQWVLGGP